MTDISQPVAANDDHDHDGTTVCAVIVSYCPDIRRLKALIDSLAQQSGQTVIVDNGSPASTLALLRQWSGRAGMTLIEFGENRGIGAAHNAGICHANAHGFGYVLLLDQDSCLQPGCVARLLRATRRLTASGIQVAAVGPQYVDETSAQRAPFWRFHRYGYCKRYARGDDDVVEASVLISSGTLIFCKTLQAIGQMDESLFIDGVDWEWCFRAASLGYRLFGVAAAEMQHSLGDDGIRVLGRTLPLHNPLRHYYVYRNMVLMCRMDHISFSWKFYFSLRLAVRLMIYLVLAPHRRARCRLIWRGLCDGWRGRNGRIPDNILAELT